jgi:hypothetical protein
MHTFCDVGSFFCASLSLICPSHSFFFLPTDKSLHHGHLNTSCAFFPQSFEIIHPLDGRFVCGKKSQANKEQGFLHFMNLFEKPYICPMSSGKAKEDAVTPQEDPHRL